MLPEMRERGVPPSDHVYRALIFANGRHQRAGAPQPRSRPPCPALAARYGWCADGLRVLQARHILSVAPAAAWMRCCHLTPPPFPPAVAMPPPALQQTVPAPCLRTCWAAG